MGEEGVVAIKEASFDAKRFVETASLVRRSPSRPTGLNGNNNFLLEAYPLGADGCSWGFGTLAVREQVQMAEAVRGPTWIARSTSHGWSSPPAMRSSRPRRATTAHG
jgi:dihydrodipicolinate synthase/N-acetylneuraminate lyase